MNPTVMGPFCDAVFPGDGEDAVADLAALLARGAGRGRGRARGASRELHAAARRLAPGRQDAGRARACCRT